MARDGRGQLALPRALHLTIGRGSTGFHGAMWMYGEQKINGVLLGDFCHDDWNGFKGAAAEAGVWIVCLERAAACNLPSGPFSGSDWFGKIKQVGRSFFQHGNTKDPAFRCLLSRFCNELNDHPRWKQLLSGWCVLPSG